MKNEERSKIMEEVLKVWQDIMIKEWRWAPILVKIQIVLSENVPTACILLDKLIIQINPKFFCSLPPEEKKFVLYHELSHLLLDHSGRRQWREKEKWNIACDCEINSMLSCFSDIKVWEGAVKPSTYKLPEDKTAEYYYDNIPDCPECQEGGEGEGEEGGGKEGEEREGKEGEGKGKEKGKGKGNSEEEGGKEEGKKGEEQGGESQKEGKGEKQGSGKGKEKKRQEKEEHFKGEISDEVRSAIEEIKKERGYGYGTLDKIVKYDKYNNKKNNKLEKALYEFLKQEKEQYDWKRKNRRIFNKSIYIPRIKREEELKVIIAIDASGSITNNTFKFFIETLKGTLKNFKFEAEVIEFDTEISHVGVFKKISELNKIQRQLGGGTDFSPVVKYANIKNEKLIILTDGDGPLKEIPKIPILWVLTRDVSHLPGKKVVIKEVET